MRIGSIFLAVELSLLVTICPNLHAQVGDRLRPTLKQLQESYRDSRGSIYLTYIPVLNLIGVLNSPAQYDLIVAKHGSDPVSVLVAFLNAYRNIPMNESIAFIQIQVSQEPLWIGYKLSNDKVGGITPGPGLTQDEIVGVASICDLSLKGLVRRDVILASMSTAKATVDDVWAEIGRLKKDPYLSEVYFSRVLIDFRRFVKDRPKEMEELERRKAHTYDAIMEFNSQFDNSLIESTSFPGLDKSGSGVEIKVEQDWQKQIVTDYTKISEEVGAGGP